MRTITLALKLAKPSADAGLLALHARWDRIRLTLDPILSDNLADLLCRSLGDLESEIAITKAHGRKGVAVKLRVIAHYVTDEGVERPHWLPLLQSALADLEGACHAQ